MKKEIKKSQLYCSLDIETSDFDPANGEVLEVGMVFFEIENRKIRILKEWQSMFKPARPVPARILALTNISIEDLEEAPTFSEMRDEIQESVRDAIIVGHNINFDIKFLEGFGIKFSGQSIDSLDLAQIFLPTNTSYNLEALMSNLEVDHKDAHRALADARATMVVVEKLLGIYIALPEQVRNEILNLLSFESCPEINSLLKHNLDAPEPQLKRTPDLEVKESREITEKFKSKRKIVTFPLGFDYYAYVYGAVQKSKDKILLVVPTKKLVYRLWQKNLAEPIFENQEVFDQEKYRSSLLDPNLTREQRMFLAKIAVWQSRNWQNKFLYDLNFNVSGKQYINLISNDNARQGQPARVIATDYLDFIRLSLSQSYSEYKTIIFDINNFEQALTFASSCKVSWSDLIYALKQIYDPASGYGKKDYQTEITDALAATDLFFGLAILNFSKLNPSSAYNFLIDGKVSSDEKFIAIKNAAENYLLKLEEYNQLFKSERIAKHLQNFKDFFIPDPEQVKWIEITEDRLALMSSPIDLAKISHQKLDQLKKVIFTACLGSNSLIKYFIRRLDLKDFILDGVGQQELRKKFQIEIRQENPDSSALLEILKSCEYPAALILSNSQAVKKFYEANFQELQKRYRVWAQGYSGGANKIFENFSINENSLLLATDGFVNKQVAHRAKVKTLIMTRLPFEQFTHPLFAAQAEKYQNQFIDFNIPRALYNFHSLIRFFYSEDLEKVYLIDAKIGKEYGKFFLDYLTSLPFVEVIYK